MSVNTYCVTCGAHDHQAKDCGLQVGRVTFGPARVPEKMGLSANLIVTPTPCPRCAILDAENGELRDELNGTIQLGNQAREELATLRQSLADAQAEAEQGRVKWEGLRDDLVSVIRSLPMGMESAAYRGVLLKMAALDPTPPGPQTCAWTLDPDGVWTPACGGDPFEFTNEHGPILNSWMRCPYCGKPLVEARPEPETEEDEDEDA